jgi:hypothetical protein
MGVSHEFEEEGVAHRNEALEVEPRRPGTRKLEWPSYRIETRYVQQALDLDRPAGAESGGGWPTRSHRTRPKIVKFFRETNDRTHHEMAQRVTVCELRLRGRPHRTHAHAASPEHTLDGYRSYTYVRSASVRSRYF